MLSNKNLTDHSDSYVDFLQKKIVIAESYGFEPDESLYPSVTMRHQSIIR